MIGLLLSLVVIAYAIYGSVEYHEASTGHKLNGQFTKKGRKVKQIKFIGWQLKEN